MKKVANHKNTKNKIYQDRIYQNPSKKTVINKDILQSRVISISDLFGMSVINDMYYYILIIKKNCIIYTMYFMLNTKYNEQYYKCIFIIIHIFHATHP